MFRYTLSHPAEGAYILPKDPKGWDQAKLGITRSPRFHGMNYSQVVALSFICGSGKEFIDNIYNNYGIDEEISIVIEECCNPDVTQTSASYNQDYSDDYEHGSATSSCDWNLLFEGILDLKNINISYARGQETQVPIIEQGLNQKLTSRLDTKIDLFKDETLDGDVFGNIDAPYNLNMHSKMLLTTAEFNLIDLTDEQTANVDPRDDQRALFLAIPLFIQFYEGQGYSSATDSYPLLMNRRDAAGGFLPFIYHNYTNFEQNLDIKANIKGSFKISEVFATVSVFEHYFTMRILLIYGNVPVSGLDPVYGTSDYIDLVPPQQITLRNLYKTFNIDIQTSLTLPLDATKQVYIAVVLSDPETPDPDPEPENLWTRFFVKDIVFDPYSNITIQTKDQDDPSVAKVQKIFETISKVSQGIMSTPDPVRSDYYGRIGATPFSSDENGCGSYAAVTSGYMIRQYPSSGEFKRGIDISINELFDSLDAIDNIGLGFEKWGSEYKLRWERKDFFYRDVEILKLTKVPNIKRTVALDYVYNDILIGFEKWQTNAINGLDEYCSKYQYTIALKSIDQSIEKLSPFIASPYIIEQVRRVPYVRTATTDTDYDNDNFIIALNRSQEYGGEPTNLNIAEKNENFNSVENVISPETSYNLRYAVCKNILRNIGSLSPIITKYTGRNIKFTSGEGNKFIVTQDDINCPSYYGNNKLNGNQDIEWDSALVEPPLYIAEYLEFEYPISRAQFSAIKDAFENPESYSHNGYITIQNQSEIFKGFLIDLQYTQLNGLTTFKLIRKYD